MKPVTALLGAVRSLQLRLMVTVIAGAVLFSAVAGALAWRQGHERAVANGRSMIEGLGSAVVKTAAVGAFAADPVLLREIDDGLVRNAWVAEAEVRSARGELLACGSRGDGAAAHALADGMVIDLPLASPFDVAERVGTLRIHANEDRIHSTAAEEALRQATLMAGQAALLALLLYALAALLVSRPIVRLARELHAMQPATQQRVAIPLMHQNDEIGVLIGGVNALLDSNAAALQRERELRAEVEAMEAQYRQIFDSSSAGIFVLDGAGRLINSNPTVSRLLGLSPTQMRELTREQFLQRVFARPDHVRAIMAQAASLGQTVSADVELVQHGDTRRWVHCLISVQGSGRDRSDEDADAPDTGAVEGVIYDITERKTREAQVRHLSEHDALTGLKNRAAADAAVDRFVDDALANGSSVSLMCIDLDEFKQINDEYGHQAGDEVLVACAERMMAAVRRSSDLIARVGGDEFIIALRDTGPDDPVLALTATALLEALQRPIVLASGTAVRVGASIGIACLPRHAHDRVGLTGLADAALYEVKRNGRNNFAMAVAAHNVVSTDVSGVPETPRLLTDSVRGPTDRCVSLCE